MKHCVYLAGAMTYHLRNGKANYFAEAVEWRVRADEGISALKDRSVVTTRNFEVFDPTIHFLDNLENEVSEASVVRQNNLYLDYSDIIVVNLQDVDKSMGTVYEICYGGIMNKTVLAFGSNEITSVPHIRHSITEQFDTLDEVIEYIDNMYHL